MLCDSYLLDSQALALLGHRDNEGNRSLIVTLHGTYTSKKTPVELLNLACLRTSSTKAHRKEEAAAILNSKHKVPFILSDGVGVFPTNSSRHSTCVWVFNHFFTTTFLAKKKTMLNFSSNIQITVPASIHSIQQQNGRLHMLISHSKQKRQDLSFEQYIYPSIYFTK